MTAPAESVARKAHIKAELWKRAATDRHGSGLQYLLLKHQRDIRNRYLKADGRVWVLCCARRWGKSRMACVLAVETAISQPNADIKYAAPTMKMARKIVVPHMQAILADCPKKMQPDFRSQDLTWTFPNGSMITLAGCDNGNADNLRGTSMDLGIVDEAGFVDDLAYVVQSVLLPQAMTTQGRLCLLSTPALSPAHDFTSYCRRAQASGQYAHRDIYSATHVTDKDIEEMKEEVGGEQSSGWRREFLAQIVIDEESAVIPEWTQEREHLVVDIMNRPSHYDAYVSADFGFNDLTVVLFAHYNFYEATICIEDEVVMNLSPSGPIIDQVREKERALWGTKLPFLRFADCDDILRSDIIIQHGMTFAKPRKDDKEAAVNALRTTVRNHKIRIHRRCQATIAHLEAAVWNKRRTKFDHAAGFGHFDAVDACIYLNREVRRGRNPFPRFINGESHSSHWVTNAEASPVQSSLKNAFRRRRTR